MKISLLHCAVAVAALLSASSQSTGSKDDQTKSKSADSFLDSFLDNATSAGGGGGNNKTKTIAEVPSRQHRHPGNKMDTQSAAADASSKYGDKTIGELLGGLGTNVAEVLGSGDSDGDSFLDSFLDGLTGSGAGDGADGASATSASGGGGNPHQHPHWVLNKGDATSEDGHVHTRVETGKLGTQRDPTHGSFRSQSSSGNDGHGGLQQSSSFSSYESSDKPIAGAMLSAMPAMPAMPGFAGMAGMMAGTLGNAFGNPTGLFGGDDFDSSFGWSSPFGVMGMSDDPFSSLVAGGVGGAAKQQRHGRQHHQHQHLGNKMDTPAKKKESKSKGVVYKHWPW